MMQWRRLRLLHSDQMTHKLTMPKDGTAKPDPILRLAHTFLPADLRIQLPHLYLADDGILKVVE